MAKRITTARISGGVLILFAAVVLFGTYRDISAGEKSGRAKGGPREVYTRDNDPKVFLITVGAQLILGLVALGSGMYFLMRPE